MRMVFMDLDDKGWQEAMGIHLKVWRDTSCHNGFEPRTPSVAVKMAGRNAVIVEGREIVLKLQAYLSGGGGDLVQAPECDCLLQLKQNRAPRLAVLGVHYGLGVGAGQVRQLVEKPAEGLGPSPEHKALRCVQAVKAKAVCKSGCGPRGVIISEDKDDGQLVVVAGVREALHPLPEPMMMPQDLRQRERFRDDQESLFQGIEQIGQRFALWGLRAAIEMIHGDEICSEHLRKALRVGSVACHQGSRWIREPTNWQRGGH